MKNADARASKGKDVYWGVWSLPSLFPSFCAFLRWVYRNEIDWYFSFDKRFYNSIKSAASFAMFGCVRVFDFSYNVFILSCCKRFVAIARCDLSVECIHCNLVSSWLLHVNDYASTNKQTKKKWYFEITWRRCSFSGLCLQFCVLRLPKMRRRRRKKVPYRMLDDIPR